MFSWVTTGDPSVSSDYSSDGLYSVWMAAYNNAFDGLDQGVTVPEWAEYGEIVFSWIMFSDDSPTQIYDVLSVGVTDESTEVIAQTMITNSEPRGAWYRVRLPVNNISSYRGRVVHAYAAAMTDESLPTEWFIDNVQLFFVCGSEQVTRSETERQEFLGSFPRIAKTGPRETQ